MFINVISKLLFDITFFFINLVIISETKLNMDTGKNVSLPAYFEMELKELQVLGNKCRKRNMFSKVTY